MLCILSEISMYIILWCIALILSIAMINDIINYRIPNICPLCIVILFFVTVYAPGLNTEWIDISQNIIVFVCSLLLGFVLFTLRICGGGDAKIIASISLWMGPAAMLQFCIVMSILGGLLALSYIFLHSPVGQYILYKTNIKLYKWVMPNVIPYGVAVCISAIINLPNSYAFQAIITQL